MHCLFRNQRRRFGQFLECLSRRRRRHRGAGRGKDAISRSIRAGCRRDPKRGWKPRLLAVGHSGFAVGEQTPTSIMAPLEDGSQILSNHYFAVVHTVSTCCLVNSGTWVLASGIEFGNSASCSGCSCVSCCSSCTSGVVTRIECFCFSICIE